MYATALPPITIMMLEAPAALNPTVVGNVTSKRTPPDTRPGVTSVINARSVTSSSLPATAKYDSIHTTSYTQTAMHTVVNPNDVAQYTTMA